MHETWWTADTHLDHDAILRHQPDRKFSCVEEMNEIFLQDTAKVVKPGDTIIHAGDWVWRNSKIGHFRARYPRRIQFHLVKGNHDSNSCRKHVSSLQDALFTKVGGYEFHVCHYPIWTWRKADRGSFHVHGHSHGSADQILPLRPFKNVMDVGIDVAYRIFGVWRPFATEEVIAIIKRRIEECYEEVWR